MRCFFIPFTGILHALRTSFRSFFLSCQKKIQSTHFFYTFGYVWFSHFLFNSHEISRLPPVPSHVRFLFSLFFRQYCGGNLWNILQPAPHTTSSPSPKKPPLKGVTPHGVGRCPEGTEGTADRRWWDFPSTF